MVVEVFYQDMDKNCMDKMCMDKIVMQKMFLENNGEKKEKCEMLHSLYC